MENSEGVLPDINPSKNEGIKIKLDEKYSHLFGIETAIVYNQYPKLGTIRVYRGINNFTSESLDNQTSNMMRFIDQNRDIKTSQEIAPIVETIAQEPTLQNYQKLIDESKKISLNNFIIETPHPFYQDFRSNLIIQHQHAIRGDVGSSPWVATTTDPFEAFNSTGVNLGAILIIDVSEDRITIDSHTDENEVLINGYIKREEISQVLLVDKKKVTKTVTDEEKSKELVNLTKELTNHHS
ncbi:MAG: hypothetical protein PHO75_01070 [Candidatus Shapirobacteria bacterium]|nr:hypothetical protein [Candidatus Shapirobacteria bacterium]